MLEFIKNVRKEAGKINFPDKETLKKNTAVTLVVCTVSALFLFGVSEAVIGLITLIVG